MAAGGDQGSGPAQAAVVGSLAAHIGEPMPQPAGHRAQPAALAAIPQQHLGDGQADQLSVAQCWSPAWPTAGFQQLIDGDVPCDDEVVETGVHEASLEVDAAFATPTLGGLVLPVTPGHPRPNTASVI
jgi:hypothetical protein